VVSVAGEVDVDSAPSFREQLDQAMAGGPDLLVVDLLGVTFIDSTALGVLIGAFKRCQADGVDLRLVITEPRILKVFEITELTQLFAIHPTVERAIAG
jgi:anti-sigma B factor antagonist